MCLRQIMPICSGIIIAKYIASRDTLQPVKVSSVADGEANYESIVAINMSSL